MFKLYFLTVLYSAGNTVGTSNQRVVYRLMVSDSVRPEDSVTLQCSVLSDFEDKTCSGDLSVFWFRSDKSHPHIFLTDGNRPDKCKKNIDHQNRCVYNFSKNISSSAAGTYYCAVATCGEILFGNGTKFKAEPTADPVLVILVSCLVISLIINIVFFCYRTPRAACKQFKEGTSSQDRRRDLSQQGDDTNEDEQDLNYAALRFSAGKATRQTNRNEPGDSVYSHIKL
ncbi:uncharacterized protein LOC124859936 [Girardinichthys multiradiatus]|uniref:uncharacterized protein LOC124859936 n=1 Tax=Girardinichthys multiradiatus TaxID=208333 RepID=UPI001FAC3F3F|nr:uncharacterized protein LOC124859936 [Girardinichthys multiradiatus]